MSTVSNPHKGLERLVLIISIVLPLVVALLFRVKLEVQLPFSPYIVPAINAALNAACSVMLVGALMAAKRKNIALHTRLIYASMAFSLLFLLGYVFYHLTTPHTKFGGEGTIKIVYLVLLFSHIALAAVQAPFVLYAFLYGYTGQIERHKRLVKYSFPIWLYVSITGVICYFMISPYYPAH